MDLSIIIVLTAAVLGVLLLVLLAVAVIVLGPAVRRSLAEREASGEQAQRSESDVDRPVADAQPAHGDGPEAPQR